MDFFLGAILQTLVYVFGALLLIGLVLAAIIIQRVNRSSSPAAGNQREAEAQAQERKAFIEDIPNVAKMCVDLSQSTFGVSLDYSEASLSKIDDIIEEHFEEGHTPLDTTVLSFGAYVGETIRQHLGGTWRDEDGLFVLEEVGGKAKIFPFNKVRKRFVNGPEDSIAFYYQALRGTIEKS